MPDNFFSQHRIDIEGLKATPWPLRRDDLCHMLRATVDKDINDLLLVRAPFASGKTALAQLLHFHIRQTNTAVHLATVAGCAVPWPQYWFEQTKVPWDAIVNSNKPVYVIIDEVQISYPETHIANSLWGSIKRLIGEKKHLVRFLCIGSYGDPVNISTPVDPSSYVSLHPYNGTPGMAYTREEFRDLITLFQDYSRVPIDDRSADFIFHMTDGHPGIVGFILRSVYEQRKPFSFDRMIPTPISFPSIY